MRQLYTNRLRTLKRNRELLKPFPYMDKMSEVDAVISLPRYVGKFKFCILFLFSKHLKNLKIEVYILYFIPIFQ